MYRWSHSALAGVLAAALAAVGCGKKHVVTLSYDRPAQYEIPDSIHRVAVLEFGGKTTEDRKWGVRAADQLAAALDEYSRKFHRYELVDRKHMSAIMKERDFKLATAGTDEVVRLGEIADVQAMIYGNVNVAHRDQRKSRTTIDVLSQRPKKVYYTARYCSASVGFAMVDVNSAKTLAAVHVSREYDSEQDDDGSGGKSVAKALGFGGDDLPPTDQVLAQLVDDCVDAFLAKISAHEVVVAEELARGKSEIVERANRLAVAGERSEALALYEQAIRQDPEDHGAVFNAGVMCEAMQEFQRAEELYRKAFMLDGADQYRQALQRVRGVTEDEADAPASG